MTKGAKEMTDDDLVKRLDNLWAMLEEDGHYVKANTVTLAKERIEALTAKVKLMDDLDVINGEKIEALTKERDEALNQWDSARHSVDVLEKRVAFVEEERRKTFQALLKVTKIHDDVETKLAKAVEGLRYYAVEAMPWDADDSLIARIALAEIEGEKE